MLKSYLPVLVFLGLGIAVGAAFTTLNRVLGPRRPNKTKAAPYECGLPSDVQRGFRFGISFYLIAMLFILFDVEAIFLYPVAVHLKAAGSVRAGRDRASSWRCCWWRSCSCGAEVRSSGSKARAAGRAVRLEQPRTADELRVRQLRARDLLRGDLEGARPRAVRRGARAHDDAREGAQLGALERAVPGHVRPRLLRDRDDVDRHVALRHARASAPRCSAPRRARPTC